MLFRSPLSHRTTLEMGYRFQNELGLPGYPADRRDWGQNLYIRVKFKPFAQ